MATGFIAKPTQPFVNGGHPLARGLRAAWLCNEHRGPKVYDHVGARHGVSTTPSWTNGPFGDCRQFLGSGNNASITTYQETPTDFTCIAWFFVVSSTAYNRIVDKKFDTGFFIGCNNGNASSIGGGIKEGVSPFGHFVTLASNKWHQIVMRRSGTTKTVIGDGFAVSTSATVVGTALSTVAIIIGDQSGGGAALTGNVDSVLFYNRALTDIEIRHLYRDPYLPFRRRHLLFKPTVIIPPPPVTSPPGGFASAEY